MIHRPFISAEVIATRVAALGQQIAETIPPGDLTVVGVLRGAFVFMADLVRAIPRELRCDFVTLSSYGDGTVSSGTVEVKGCALLDVEGRHVLIVEDIVDTGLTVRYLVDSLELRGAASVSVCALLSKPARRRADVDIAFVGFEVPDQFLVGYGLDAAQRFRHLPYIAAID